MKTSVALISAFILTLRVRKSKRERAAVHNIATHRAVSVYNLIKILQALRLTTFFTTHSFSSDFYC